MSLIRKIGNGCRRLPAAVALTLIATTGLTAQVVETAPEEIVTVQRGSSAFFTFPDSLERVSVADPEIAEAVAIPPQSVLVNGRTVGSTSLMVWIQNVGPILYEIQVNADVASLQRQIQQMFPDVDVDVSTTGEAIVLSGQVRDPSVVRRITELAGTTGAPVVNNLQAPSPEQILLNVQIAEVNSSVLKELGGQLIRVRNPETLDHAFDRDDEHVVETMAEGFVSLMVSDQTSRLDAVIRALKQTGDLRSLAEPNLTTLEGTEASFLAGGEFPFPVLQGGQGANAVTIEWREFGVRLNFTPTITNAGNIRLHVQPEVSSLDFANGLVLSGFEIPSLLTRRTDSEVELAEGQWLAIGGLLDNSVSESVDKIPLLGDIPILGTFFKSTSERQNRTELLVLVQPHIVEPSNEPPPLPTGPVREWEWDGHIEDYFPIEEMGAGR